MTFEANFEDEIKEEEPCAEVKAPGSSKQIQWSGPDIENLDQQAKSRTTASSESSLRNRLSKASRAYDRDNKGYLDDLEKIVRSYDVNGDGKISTEEVFKIVQDLKTQKKRARGYRRGVIGLSLASIFLLACVFGLMFATVVLTRTLNVGSQDTLVSEETGHVLRTGNYVPHLMVELTKDDQQAVADGKTDAVNIFGTKRSRNLHGRRRLAVFDNYAGLTYIGRVPKTRFETVYNNALNDGYTDATLSTPQGDLDICMQASTVKIVDQSDDLGGVRYVGIQKQDSASTACDPSTHYLFSCGGTDYVDKCYIYEVLAPVAKVGGTTSDSAKVTFRLAYAADVTVRYNTDNDFNAGYTETTAVSVIEDNDYTGTIELSGLSLASYGAAQTYYYRLAIDGDEFIPAYEQKFQTFPGRSVDGVDMSQHSVDIVIYADAGVSKTGLTAEAYENCPSAATLALQIGDLDHSNNVGSITSTALDDRKAEYLTLVRKMHREQINQVYPQGQALVENVLSKRTFSHVWDDHDYCGNDTDETCEYKEQARQAYFEYYTGYDLPNPADGIYHKIELGDVDIFMLDMRSQRSPNADTDNSAKSVLGTTQKDWLKSELTTSDSKWKIIVSSISANSYARPTNTDHWISFQTEAEELKLFLQSTISANDGAPLSERTIMISGDLHTGGGIDSGCNNRLGIPEIGIPHTNLYSGGNTDFVGVWSEIIRDGNAQTAEGYVGGFGHISATSTKLTLRIKDANGIALTDSSGTSVEFSLPNDPNCPADADPEYLIVDTNQDVCYDATSEMTSCPNRADAFYGQDAQHNGLALSYQDNGDGTITDLNTGLMWTADPSERISYEDALAVANRPSTGGYDDWVIPTVKQLFSLMDFKGREPPPTGTSLVDAVRFIDSDDAFFSFNYGSGTIESVENATCTDEYRLIDAQFITTTEYVSQVMTGKDCFFGVNFADGRIKCYPKDPNIASSDCIKKFYAYYVRSVDNSFPTYGINDFTDNGDGTITDLASKLMWDQDDNGSGLTWEDALDYVKRKNRNMYKNYDDWRLPNIKELQSIVDYSRSPDTTGSAAINALFSVSSITNEAGNSDFPYFWSSTTHRTANNDGKNAAYIAFGRALGKINGSWLDVHGAGAQRSDPKSGDPTSAQYVDGFGPQGDAIRINNYVRLVRDVVTV